MGQSGEVRAETKDGLTSEESADRLTAALAGAEAAVWRWSAQTGAFTVEGASAAGLGSLHGIAALQDLEACVLSADRPLLLRLTRPGPVGEAISLRLRMTSGPAVRLRGKWIAEGVATGLALLDQRRRDRLTGLLDRAGFLEEAQLILEQGEARRLVVADLARLSRLNEALGHARADKVLAALGARLLAGFPADSIPARIGDDTFALLLPGAAEDAEARVRAALEQPLRLSGMDIYPSMAIGSALHPAGGEADAAELLRRAEVALKAPVADRPAEQEGMRLALEGDLRGAIERGEIEPFYQPIVRLSDGQLAGFEALVRWRHPRRGLMTPDDFLPLIGESGRMGELSLHMPRTAARQLADWREKHREAGDLFVSVNLTPGDLERDDLVPTVRTILAETPQPAGSLKLEITEGEVMRDPDQAAQRMSELREAGATLALDDFGMGFSSLSYLARLPVSVLKIDRYFVRTMGANDGSAKIVRSVCALAQDLGLEVVGEGVENAAMAQDLLQAGGTYGQGYGYAPPLGALEAEVFLNECYLDGGPLKPRG